MFEDKMYLKTGIAGKDLQRAIHKYGIFDRRMKEAKELKEQEEKMLKERLMEVEKARAMGGRQPLSSHFKQNE